MADWLADSTGESGRKVKGGAPALHQSLRLPLHQTLWENVTSAVALESQRLTIWSPMLLVLGIWAYFQLPNEPPQHAGLFLGLACLAVIIRWPHRRALAFLAVLALGFAAAQFRATTIATPLLRAYTPDVNLTGYVWDIDPKSASHYTLIITTETATQLPSGEVPRRARIEVYSKDPPPLLGDHIQLQATLAPLPRPSMPGGFDYGRQLYFSSIGAEGRSKGPIATIDDQISSSMLPYRWFRGLRLAISHRIRQAIPGPTGAIADAMVSGERAAIPNAMVQSLQSSGLFHILSISGLHMSLVAGGVFWVVRALLALSATMALRYPIKKWAAVAALLVGAVYMLMADSGAATERSFIMIAVVFFAVLVDRPALSLTNLAVAAIIILLREPEQALAASFQMSFMAVMGLAAFFAWWKPAILFGAPRNNQPALGRMARKAAAIVTASLATSLIAGALSSIPAAHHFGRLAPYGLVANALALPIVSVVVMPVAMLSVLLMPLGLDHLPLQVMGWGLQTVMAISDWVASWPAAREQWPHISAALAATLSIATGIFCLGRSRLRWLGLPVAGIGLVLFWPTPPTGGLLIEERASNVALIAEEGLVPADDKYGGYAVKRWLNERGEDVSVKQAAARPGWECLNGICNTVAEGLTVTYARSEAENNFQCPITDILITQFPLHGKCQGQQVTLDRFDVWRDGAHAVSVEDLVAQAISVREMRGNRPWVYEPRARSAKPLADTEALDPNQ